MSYAIGQHYKSLARDNGGNLTNVQETDHILAHGVLAAAVSVATGNDPTTGALSAMGSEKGAKYVSQYLYKTDDPSKLTPEQKETVSSITSLAGLTVGGSTGSVTNAVNAAETSKVAVQNNGLVDNADFATTFGQSTEYGQSMQSIANYCTNQGGNTQACVNNITDPSLKDKYLSLIYKRNNAGHLIVCITSFTEDCSPRIGERYATKKEIFSGSAEILLDVIPVEGLGAQVVVKRTREVIGIYEDVKTAKQAIQVAKKDASIAENTTVQTSTFPDYIYSGKQPLQTTPGTKYVKQERFNPKTGELEVSDVYYDQFGRQIKRIDYTNHGRGNTNNPKEYHSNPHTHTYEYGPGKGGNGQETRINH